MVQQQRWLTEQCQEQLDSSSEEEILSDVEVRSKSFTPRALIRAGSPKVVVKRVVSLSGSDVELRLLSLKL